MSGATKSWWRIGEFVAHGSAVNCVSLSPSNGRMLATGGDDRKINLWVIGKPNAILSISGMTSPVRSVTFNQTENWIGAGSKSGVVKVFDLDETKVVRSISGHRAAICSVDFHRFGDVLASGSMDTNLKLWDVRRKGCIFTYKGHTESINSIQFSPDGKWVVSASSDSTIKVWDLCAGRMLADFKEHKGPVTSVEFHPQEYLLASGSTDRTAKIWDLESFQLLSESLPESNPVRQILFHPEGRALFSGSHDTLKVHGWEPVVVHDHILPKWGKVADMAIYDEQLIGATFANNNVSLYCVNMEYLRPFSGESSSPQPSATVAPLSSSGRKHFEYERQVVALNPASHRPHTQISETSNLVEEEGCSPSSSSEEVGVQANDSPPTQLKDEERRELFVSRERLMRTPPKHENPPFLPPLGNEATPLAHQHDQQEDPPTLSQPGELNRVQVLQIHSSDVRSSDRDTRPPPKENRAPINVASHRVPPQPSDPQIERMNQRKGRQDGGRGQNGGHGQASHQQPQQQAKKAPSRHLIDEFMQPPTANVSEPKRGGGLVSESRVAIRELVTNHSDVCQILKSRLEVLKDTRAEWSVNEPKSALEVAINSGNPSALVDLLNVLHLKRTLWTLEISLLILPELHSLISSRHSSHVKCCCKVLKLILKSFGPLIKTNLAMPPSHGDVDITREERYERCLTCHSHLTSLRDESTRLVRDSPTSSAGKVIREQSLLNTFTILD